MKNLEAEMARFGVRKADIQALLGCTEKTVWNKIAENTDFTFPEVLKIRDTFFPGLQLEYLFQPDPKPTSAGPTPAT